MKRIPVSILLSWILLLSSSTWAEDSVTLFGNYYKERSTRVVEPMIELHKDLPFGTEARLNYLVDQITSASSGTTAADEVFRELRQEARFGLKKRFEGITPGASIRYSAEPDYKSLTIGADLAFSFFREHSELRAAFQYQTDDIAQRGRAGFSDRLGTKLLELSWTQILRKDTLVGLSLETQRLRGYQENAYRVENHPRARDRYAAQVWGAYHHAPTGTTPRVAYRIYTDDWDLVSHTLEIEICQRILEDLEIRPMVRVYTQNGVYFVSPSLDGFYTTDPKLRPFGSSLFGIEVAWTLSIFADTPLAGLAHSRIQPSYGYFDQRNAYGSAHIAQLGWYWPF